jgi:UDP-hydrolysing UDP-N-acetyl-D-glucosamine 2-epimerase
MSHLHFVAAAAYGRRLRQMGEEPWRITVSGAPGLDSITALRPLPGSRLEKELGVPVDRRTLLVTYHPETLGRSDEQSVAELLAALDGTAAPMVFTMPNADTGRDAVSRSIANFVEGSPGRVWSHNLGHQRYLSVMARVGAMVGNSSSGIIEAPTFRLPVVNVGDRQRGRIRARNVIDVPPARRQIAAAIKRALDPRFRRSLASLKNPYGNGGASKRIARVLLSVPLDRKLLVKRFAAQ